MLLMGFWNNLIYKVITTSVQYLGCGAVKSL